jgi:hypothetical protein
MLKENRPETGAKIVKHRLVGLLLRNFHVTVKKNYVNKKKPAVKNTTSFYRGRERIRTAVQGFADLCLATRPPDLF